MKQAPALRQTIRFKPVIAATHGGELTVLTHDTVTALEPTHALGYAGAVAGSFVSVARPQ